MKIQKLLQENQNTQKLDNYIDIDIDYRRKKAEAYTQYLLNTLKKDGFEEIAFLELEQHIVSQSITYINKFVEKYGETVRITYFFTIFTPEFIAKIHDYNNHLG